MLLFHLQNDEKSGLLENNDVGGAVDHGSERYTLHMSLLIFAYDFQDTICTNFIENERSRSLSAILKR